MLLFALAPGEREYGRGGGDDGVDNVERPGNWSLSEHAGSARLIVSE